MSDKLLSSNVFCKIAESRSLKVLARVLAGVLLIAVGTVTGGSAGYERDDALVHEDADRSSLVSPRKNSDSNEQHRSGDQVKLRELPSEVSVFFYHGDVVYDENGAISGIFVDRMHCITEKMGIKMKTFMVDWSRGQNYLKSGILDIMASTIKSELRDSYADFSPSNHIHRFVLVMNPKFHRSIKLPSDYRQIFKIFNKRGYSVSVIGVSAEESTIRLTGFKGFKFVNTLDEMVKSIISGDSQAMVTELELIEKYEKEHGQKFIKHFLFEMPCGYYISKKITSRYPKFMQRFNAAHQQCVK